MVVCRLKKGSLPNQRTSKEDGKDASMSPEKKNRTRKIEGGKGGGGKGEQVLTLYRGNPCRKKGTGGGLHTERTGLSLPGEEGNRGQGRAGCEGQEQYTTKGGGKQQGRISERRSWGRSQAWTGFPWTFLPKALFTPLTSPPFGRGFFPGGRILFSINRQRVRFVFLQVKSNGWEERALPRNFR